jgi:rubrerythrin/ferredoxin
MANVTFVSPSMPRDVTVYAVAGDRGTILALAKEHKIPIPFDCQDGECGSCLVRVEHTSSVRPYGIALTEKEKERLKELGKITKEEVMNAEVNDMPPTYRLACQCFVRNEDIIVSFEGDAAAAEKQPHLSIAAAVYTGGVKIETTAEFLGLAVQVEEDAAIHFEKLAKNMEACGNTDVAALFAQLAGYSRLHLKEAKERAGKLDAPVTLPPKSAWPNNETPERTALWAGDPGLSRLDALKAALQGERRGYEFYYAVASTSSNVEIRKAAREFVLEEAQHVDTLKLWISKEEATLREKPRASA